MSLSDLLLRARPAVEQKLTRLDPPYTVFLSVSDGKQRAKVTHASGDAIHALWQQLVTQIRRKLSKASMDGKWLRIDWVTESSAMTWHTLNEQFQRTKRGYFRYGIALDPNHKTAFLEQELNGNAMLYGGNKIAHPVVNEGRFRAYTDIRFSKKIELDFSQQSPVYRLSTEGIFLDRNTPPQALYGPGRNAGRRVITNLDEKQTYELIHSSSQYLSSQVKRNGLFEYGWHCCFDRAINTYNTLRHASSTYAMIEAWEVTGDPTLKKSIDRSLTHLTTRLIKRTKLESGEEAAFLLESNGEIKLGGNAVCLLALVKYSEVTRTQSYLSLMQALAIGIHHMQDQKTGKFVHVLQHPDLSVKEAFRIIYYDGEAAFGLMRLYGFTRDQRWLSMVEKAFDYFIANEHWRANDHWLSYCVNELTLYRPEERYYQFGLQNVVGHLDFIIERITTFPTLLELIMAAERMVVRLEREGRFPHLLQQLDLKKFYRALHTRAMYLLNGYYWPEYAMYFKNPEKILGSFFIRHHAFRVRIDDVEHYLSGYIAFYNYLRRQQSDLPAPEKVNTAQTGSQQQTPSPTEKEPTQINRSRSPDTLQQETCANWNIKNIIHACGGTWAKAPSRLTWQATGLCIFHRGMKAGNIIACGPSKSGRTYIPIDRIETLPFTPQAIIVDQMPSDTSKIKIPIILVDNLNTAIIRIGKYARSEMRGKVIGITGSSGKTTTTAMLQHFLKPWGNIEKTSSNANLPAGISWNLASIDWRSPYTIVEMAIGNMKKNSAIARPDIAIITNIGPAHLEYHHSTEQIALKKSRIFSSMQEGGIAILNRDINEWDTLLSAAKEKSLQIFSFGQKSDADIQLDSYDIDNNLLITTIEGQKLEISLGAPGIHMAYNCLACLTAIYALGLDLEPAVALAPYFSSLPGRGKTSEILIGGKNVAIIDDAYNANPESMKAALTLTRHAGSNDLYKRKILVLGDMLELGDRSESLHNDLVPYISACNAERVFLVGNQISRIEDRLRALGVNTSAYENAENVKDEIVSFSESGDLILFKGSHGSGVHQIPGSIHEV